jgi:hypothetical protein
MPRYEPWDAERAEEIIARQVINSLRAPGKTAETTSRELKQECHCPA